MQRYKIIIEYDGSSYVGWQKQDNGISIQESLEESIKSLTSENVQVFGAGRTDAGVHALGQVAHFDLKKKCTTREIQEGLNQYLKPRLIAIIDAKVVSKDFHARFSAKKRIYSYTIVNRRSPLTIDKNKAWIIYKKLDMKLISSAAKFFIGKNDLTSFRAVSCQARSPIKTIDDINITREDDKILFKVTAKSFLQSQVRIMVGTLANVGEGKIRPKEILSIIEAKDRSKAGPTAPPEGLFLKEIIY